MFLAFGESLEVVDSATGAGLYSITVVGVTPDVACTAPGATAAENGHLVAVELLVTTVSDVVADDGGNTFDATDFVVVASDGTTIYPATAAASACLTPEEGLPAGSLPAGQQYAGTVVLDVTETTGSIVHRPDPLAAGAVWGF